MNRWFSSLLAIFAMGFLATLSAHETWLLPVNFAGPAGQAITLDLTSGMDFPQPEHAIKQERVAVARFRLGTEETEVKHFQGQQHTLRLALTPSRQGVATVWVQLHPKHLALKDAQVEEYFAEINATEEIRAAWARLRGKHPWNEDYTKCAKTFVAVGAAGADHSWQKPVGLGLELVPQANPLALTVGKKASFVLLAEGKPLGKVPVGLMVEGVKGRVFQTTDDQGQVSFPIEKAGKVLIYAVDLRLDGTSWTSRFTTLTGCAKPE